MKSNTFQKGYTPRGFGGFFFVVGGEWRSLLFETELPGGDNLVQT